MVFYENLGFKFFDKQVYKVHSEKIYKGKEVTFVCFGESEAKTILEKLKNFSMNENEPIKKQLKEQLLAE